MWERTKRTMQKICDALEFCVAIVVGISLILTVISYIPQMGELIKPSTDTTEFLIFLDEMFNLVIGIEFMKILCKPSTENVIDVLIFLVARHMIIGNNSATDLFLSVISIAILCVIRQVFSLIGRGRIKLAFLGKKEEQPQGDEDDLEGEQAEE